MNGMVMSGWASRGMALKDRKPKMQAIRVTPRTTLRRLIAPSIRGPIMILASLGSVRRAGGSRNLVQALRPARPRAGAGLSRRHAHLLAFVHIGLADRDHPGGAVQAGHPHAVGGLLDHGDRGEGHAAIVQHIAHP